MNIKYSLYDLKELNINKNSIFLAGPTPRDNNTKSWRPKAIKILNRLKFDGIIINPEYDSGLYDSNIDVFQQIEWENIGLTDCGVILFWIPRNMNNMPGLTTNDEWGTWKTSGKVVLGTPRDAEHVRYQRYYAKKLNIYLSITLEETIINALTLLKELYI